MFLLYLIFAVASGVLTGLTFPDNSFSFLIFFSLVPLFFIAEDKRVSFKKKFFLFLVAGTVTYLVGFSWINNTMILYGHIPPWLSHIFSFVFSLFSGLFMPVVVLFPFAIAGRFNSKWRFFYSALGMMVFEYIFPKFFLWTFGNMAFKDTLLIQTADIFGSFGVSFLVFSVNLLLFIVVRNLKSLKDIPCRDFALLAALIVAAHVYGAIRLSMIEEKPKDYLSTLNVAMIQANFSLDYLSSNRYLTMNDWYNQLYDMVELTGSYINETGEDFDLVVWPESTFSFVYNMDEKPRNIVGDMTKTLKTDLMITSFRIEENTDITDRRRTKTYSTSTLIGESGDMLGFYRKIYLIPFGETIPFAETFPKWREFLESFVSNISSFDAGHDYTVMTTTNGSKVGSAICMDALDASISRNIAANGANLIVSQSNFAWFGEGGSSGDVLELLRFRAIESRVPVAMIANSGHSVFMDAAGRNIVAPTETFDRDAISAKLYLKPYFSLYRMVGDVFVIFGLFVFALKAFFLFISRRTSCN